MSLCSYADTLSMLSLIWVDIISLFIYTQDALQELLYYVLFDTEQLILCSSTIKGKIFLKLFQSFLRILFFSGLLFYKQDEEEVTVQWGIFFSSHNFFPHAGLHFNKDSQIQSAEELHPLFISLWSWQKKWKPKEYTHNGPVIFDCLSKRVHRYYDTTQNRGPLLWETHYLENCHSTSLIPPIEFREQNKPFFLVALVFQSKIYF